MIRKCILSTILPALALGAFPAVAAAHEHAPAAPALWQLADEDTTIYLFGTIHVLPEGENWFAGHVASAFNASEELVFEISLDSMDDSQAQLANLAMLEPGTILRSLMTAENRAEYEAALGTFGIPPEALDPFEPWAASLNLALLPLIVAGYQPNAGAEMVLRRMGEDKTRRALETVEQQLGFFDTLPMEAQLELLDGTVAALPTVVSSLDALKAEWLEGDAETIGALMNEGLEDPALYELLLVSRNRNWAGWIADRMEQPGTVFIAVGAGHLAGAGSVQEQLAERGLAVERVRH